MFDVVCVTSRKHSKDFFKSIEEIAKSDVSSIILREKDLTEAEYLTLAENVKKICDKYGKSLVVNNFTTVAERLGIKSVHLPFSLFKSQNNLHSRFAKVGTSVHSVEDAVFAENAGADYIIAGHIFATDCKKGLEPRGVEYLNSVCSAVSIPVYAIGGIDDISIKELSTVNSNNFAGVCVMSALMKSNNPKTLVRRIKDNYNMNYDRKKFLLYAITDRHWLGSRTLEEDIEQALKGGATLIQLREKNISFEEYCKTADSVHRLCQSYGVPLIINDNTEVARAVNAEGVHLGQNDMSIIEARQILGEDKIIGATARTKEQAVKAEQDGADYVGSGAVFGTSTKADAVKMSLDTLRDICSSISIPVTAIGGITKENIFQLNGTGVAGAAVVSGIFAENDIYNSTVELKNKIEEIVNGK